MQLTKWQQLGLAATLAGVLVVGATALVVHEPASSSGPAKSPETSTPTQPTASVLPEPTVAPTPVVDAAVTAQLDYVLAHWEADNYNAIEWGVLGENDCVNFASQAMIERGWSMDEAWSSPRNGNAYGASVAWRSSTAFMNYIASTGKATALSDQQRDQVKVGDIAQFDWDNSGDRDHTGIVTRVERTGDTIAISFAGHTLDSDYRSVDTAITVDHPGATAYYWSVP